MTQQTTAETIATIGIDLGKNTFHLIGMDARGKIGSCPVAWCNRRRTTAITGQSRDDQIATAGKLTKRSSLIGAMVSSVR
jgi:hypothetical protein